jgi:hypothetical protein
MGDDGYNPRDIAQGSIEFTACEELVMVGSASQSASGVSHVIRQTCGPLAAQASSHARSKSHTTCVEGMHTLSRCHMTARRSLMGICSGAGMHGSEHFFPSSVAAKDRTGTVWRKYYKWLRGTRGRRTELCRIVHASVDDASIRPGFT